MWNHVQIRTLLLLTLLGPLTTASTSVTSDNWNAGFAERRVTHQSNDVSHTNQTDDVTVLVPRPGAGRYVGLLTRVTNWPDQLTNQMTDHVSAFLGIPYAAKPEGNLRFRLPRPAYLDSRRRWVSRGYRSACLQSGFRFRLEPLNLSQEHFSEDCLYLNLFVPGNASEKRQQKLPVLVNIHGGTLMVGGVLTYPGQVLAAKGIVMATFSYRLNIFGLISTDNYAAPGNLALWDQRAALMWIRDNVEFFGGDPDRVTLSGESAGASSVGLHIVSNGRHLSGGRPLFQQAVLMSGADIANWAVSRPTIGEHVSSVHQMASLLGCQRATRAAIVECLRRLPAADIENFSLRSEYHNFAVEPEWLWAPVVDGVLIDEIPLVKRRAGDFMRLPIMGGCTRDDTVRFGPKSSRNARRYLKDEFTRLGNKKIAGIDAIIDEAIRLYSGNSNGAMNNAEFNQLIDSVTRDYEMIEPVYQVLRFHAERQPAQQPVFMYEFDYEKPFQSLKRVGHGDDLDYILGVPFVTPEWWRMISQNVSMTHFEQFSTDEQRRMSDFVMTLWTNFVKSGDPTPEPVNGFKWDRLLQSSNATGGRCAILNLPERSRMAADYKIEEMRLWKRLYDSELQYVLQLNQQPRLSAGLVAVLSAAVAVASNFLSAAAW